MVTKPPVGLLKVAVKVSAGSTTLSFVMETVKVWMAPATEPAGKVSVPFLAV
ncbi:hypothetical protein D3C72_2019210 [compost metagenome]